MATVTLRDALLARAEEAEATAWMLADDVARYIWVSRFERRTWASRWQAMAALLRDAAARIAAEDGL